MQTVRDLYTERMNREHDRVDLKELRCLVAIVEAGTFTDAAIELGISQAAVSRNLASLERKLGTRLMRRTTRQVELTPAGHRAITTARRVLGGMDDLVREARDGDHVLRLGYAWSAVGEHTVDLQRRWAAKHPETALELFRSNTPTAGLADGRTDLAILRRAPAAGPGTAMGTGVGESRIESMQVGLEKRYCAIAADDPWARRRAIPLAEFTERTLVIDERTGSTSLRLWPADAAPAHVILTTNIDDWLTAITAGRGVGITSEATSHQYPRPGVVYRPVKDAPPIVVELAWPRADPHPLRHALADLLGELYAP
jgi:DNA-binding transcriptional LysR family regulator